MEEERETDRYSDIVADLMIRNRALCLNKIKYYKYKYRFILRSLKLMEMVKVVKSQTLTGLIFNCDLNFGKMNVDSCSRGRN